jgi:glycine/D-amino acid oxidase-like deaminating enzyme
MDLLSGAPFWPIRDGLLATYPPLERSVRCDVAIIGGGISGACVAHELTAAGLDVVVLDRRDIGTGSTAGSTSLLQYELDTPLAALVARMGEPAAARVMHRCVEAVERIGELAAKSPFACGFRRRESLYGASRAGDVAALRTEYELRRRHGFDVRFWDRAAVTARSSLPFAAAIVSQPAAEVDAHCLAHGLLRRAVARGARVHDRTRVRDWRVRGRGVLLRTDRGAEVRAGRLVVAAGYEADSFLRSPATRLLTTFALITEPVTKLPGWPGRRLIWETARPYFYARTTDDNRILMGGEDEPFVNPTRRAAALPAKARALLRHFRRWFPAIAVEPAYRWAGTFATTDDGLPFIGPHRAHPHVFFALGYGGNGITFSVVAAGIIRDLCLGKKNADAALFRFGRSSAPGPGR